MTLHLRRAHLGAALAVVMLVGPPLVAAAPTGYMRCYQARRTKQTPKFAQVDVSLQDQFTVSTTTVRGQRELCNPASVDGSFVGGVDLTAHLTCYATRDRSQTPKFRRLNVQVTNAFGTQQLSLSKPFQLCVPSEKGIVPAPPTPSSLAIDHYRCYKANLTDGFVFTPPTDVDIGDQFGSTTADIRPGNRLTFCNPVSKNGSPILNSATHLTCFRLLEPAGDSNVGVTIDNQFADGQSLTVRRTVASRRICLPSTMTGMVCPADAFVGAAALP